MSTCAEAVQFVPEMAAAQNARGVIALQAVDPETAEALISEALEDQSPMCELAHFNLALIAESRGDAKEAERLYKQELELYPRELQGGIQPRSLVGSHR